MKKIIAAFDGLKFSGSTLDYAVAICRQSDAHLAGVFLEDFTYHSYKIYELITEKGLSEKKMKLLEQKDDNSRHEAVNLFEAACRKAAIEHTIHHDRSIAIRELLHESIYADLLLVDARETLTHYEEKVPTRFIRDLLTDVQCPVMLLPSKYKPIQKLVLLYDGEPSSVHALKMFSYLLPSLKQLPVEVISVKNMQSNLHLPDNTLMKEFMKRHYPHAEFTILKGLPETVILNRLKEINENILLVLGAYRRGAVSRWFRASMADTLMQELHVPLFIAHNK